ncbi:MAG: hypothetical protein M1825_002279, partial [Sarcosagium campestre]
NAQGETGLFPSNYVELVEGEEESHHGGAVEQPAHKVEPAPSAGPAGGAASAGPTAVALYDYEAAEENELSFPEGAKITDLEFPDDDWWFGRHGTGSGLFPSNYVQLED